ncbi:MAG: PEP-CTERM/exosortase system-associated acyltransferase [Methylobacter sp.]|nr:PEP-CTERM/exosortase system-associated acyltransferase [Methylobacter sp.]
MFDDQFEFFLADTDKSKEIHYSIRYQVYCEEMGFENKDDFPLEQEFDEYDDHSIHFIVRHKPSRQWVGAMRLIFKNGQPLPMERHCILHEFTDTSNSDKSVELSRLCFVKEIRRRVNDVDPPYGIPEDRSEVKETHKVRLLHNPRCNNRSIIWGLLRVASEYGYRNNIQNCFFLTTNALAKIIRRSGLKMMNIGEPCNYNGERFPFKMNVTETYFSEIWNDQSKKGYYLFSEMGALQKQRAA